MIRYDCDTVLRNAKQLPTSFVWRPTGRCLRRSMFKHALDMTKSGGY